jgi:hypothetical protein
MVRKRANDDERPSRWERLSAWNRHLICLAFLLVVSAGFFWPLHFGEGSLAGSDSVNWRAQAEAMIEYRKATGREALWNPNSFAGMPDFNPRRQVPQLNDALKFLRGYIWPTSHFIFLLAGTYLLIFFLTGSSLGGVLAACGFGLTTYIPIILSVGHNTKFIALCLAPWMALAFAYCLRRPRLLAALLFAAALAANLQAGHVQITYYVSFLLGVWWIAEGIAALRRKKLVRFGKVTGTLALGSLLGVLMVAQPYFTNAQYKQYSTRGEGGPSKEEAGLETDYAMRWSQGAGELVTLAVAGAYGGGGETYWGPKPFTEGPHYLGVIVLLLAGLALWRLRRRVVWAFGVGALLMTLFALGRHFASLNELMYAYFPLFDAFRAPETWMSMVSFALAVLAGLGAYYAARREPKDETEQAKSRSVYVALGVAGGFLGLLLLFQGVFFDFEKPNERQKIAQQVAQRAVQQQPSLRQNVSRLRRLARQRADQYVQKVKQEREASFSGDVWRALLFLALAAAALVAHRRGVIPAWTMQAALALLVVFDLGGVGRRYLSADDLKQSGGYEAGIPTFDFDRFINRQRKQADAPFRVLSLKSGNPFSYAIPSYHHQSLGGYHGAKLQLYQDYIDHIYQHGQRGAPNENALDLLNTRYVVARRPLPGYEVAYRGKQSQLLVLRNPDAVPRAFFVGQTKVIDEPKQMWKRLRSKQFDPQQTALLSEPLDDFETTPIDSGSTAKVLFKSFSPRKIVWNVRTDAPRLLVASEVYYPVGWKAYVDGERVPIHRADYLLRAVPVPEGEHRVVMRYEPESRTWTAWIGGGATALTYGGILVLLGLAYRRRRRSFGSEAHSDDRET